MYAEVSELLIGAVDSENVDLIAILGKLPIESDYLRRGQFDESDHVFWHYRHNNMAELRHRIWKAQVQVLFPLIELERIRIISELASSIKSAINEHTIFQFHEIVTSPEEIELGTLVYMMKHRDEFGDYYLYIPDEELRERIHFLHNCRNKLAHANCCTPTEVQALLNL